MNSNFSAVCIEKFRSWASDEIPTYVKPERPMVHSTPVSCTEFQV